MHHTSPETFPTELWTSILESSPDFASLHHMIQASPVARRVFNLNAMSILETVLQNTVPLEVRSLIQYTAHLRRCDKETAPTKSAPDYWHDYLYPADRKPGVLEGEPMEHVIQEIKLEMEARIEPGLPLDHGMSGTNPHAYKPMELLLLIKKMSILADACIGHYRTECATREVKTEKTELHPEIMYQPKDYGPPSWTETQRASRALWQIEQCCQIRRALYEGRLGWNYLLEDDEYYLWLSWYYQSVPREIALYGIHFALQSKFVSSFDPGTDDNSWTSPYEMFKANFTLEKCIVNRPFSWPEAAHRPDCNKGPHNPEFRINAPPHGYYYSHMVMSPEWICPTFVRYLKYDFRGLGFMIWDKPRLVRMGLISAPEAGEQDQMDLEKDRVHNQIGQCPWLNVYSMCSSEEEG
ncbi:hypothetical protein VFPPC_01726 [Pochonia chlamydosporia 170]|uniref:Uncharacterized protein n=1 Tax=Pochonia chlamydosporia 170 TaxID=1380566 RepID=A0A179G8M6_METCM|nr:hypothetical protein VFPPC_01726 [Pochonia chlamydosporia 170]OAQ74162.1 hypothetical protein VFPPC_01726 [Pochonia chlamydosporia 170]